MADFDFLNDNADDDKVQSEDQAGSPLESDELDEIEFSDIEPSSTADSQDSAIEDLDSQPMDESTTDEVDDGPIAPKLETRVANPTSTSASAKPSGKQKRSKAPLLIVVALIVLLAGGGIAAWQMKLIPGLGGDVATNDGINRNANGEEPPDSKPTGGGEQSGAETPAADGASSENGGAESAGDGEPASDDGGNPEFDDEVGSNPFVRSDNSDAGTDTSSIDERVNNGGHNDPDEDAPDEDNREDVDPEDGDPEDGDPEDGEPVADEPPAETSLEDIQRLVQQVAGEQLAILQQDLKRQLNEQRAEIAAQVRSALEESAADAPLEVDRQAIQDYVQLLRTRIEQQTPESEAARELRTELLADESDVSQIENALAAAAPISNQQMVELNLKLHRVLSDTVRLEMLAMGQRPSPSGNGNVVAAARPAMVRAEQIQKLLNAIDIDSLEPAAERPSWISQSQHDQHLATWNQIKNEVAMISETLLENTELTAQQASDIHTRLHGLLRSTIPLETRRLVAGIEIKTEVPESVSEDLRQMNARLAQLNRELAQDRLRLQSEVKQLSSKLDEIATLGSTEQQPDDTAEAGEPNAALAQEFYSQGYAKYFSQNSEDLTAAKKYFALAVKNNPNNPAYRYFLALALYRQGHQSEAEAEVAIGRNLERRSSGFRANKTLYRIQGPIRTWLEGQRNRI